VTFRPGHSRNSVSASRQMEALIVITKRSLEAKILIEWLWRSEGYSREELQQAFAAGGFRDVTFGDSRQILLG